MLELPEVQLFPLSSPGVRLNHYPTPNSTSITTRLGTGRLTTRNPAAANALSAPTLISPQVTSFPIPRTIGYPSTARPAAANARINPRRRNPARVTK
jgi:hypothetical protein